MDPIKLEERRNEVYLKKKEERARLNMELKSTLAELKVDLGKQLSRKRISKEMTKYYINQNGCSFFQIEAIEKGNNYTINSLLAYAHALGLKVALVEK